MSTQQLNAAEYEQFKEFLEKSCGLVLGDNKHYLVTSRLTGLLDEYRVGSVGELIKLLVSRPPMGMKERIIEAMTTNETFWFRDGFPFDILKNRLYPELDQGRQIKIWSAACSTGQEAYSISMTAEEYRAANPGKLRGDVRIVGTDISPAVVKQAQQGRYDHLAMTRGLSPERKQKFFRQIDEKTWEVIPQIKTRASFRTLNLLESYRALGKFDIVFCRNVLIYFSAENKKDIINRIAEVLNPRGYLFLGASESITSYSDAFEMIRCNPGVLYRLKQ
ncbi:MAG: protein-glutamate O-methyltransferase CheR [Gammaproteobacteria bacterium]|nr:MAG: protein-glutamate O-methyltransferase CheR [Gammaproteobacteria bacterium]